MSTTHTIELDTSEVNYLITSLDGLAAIQRTMGHEDAAQTVEHLSREVTRQANREAKPTAWDIRQETWGDGSWTLSGDLCEHLAFWDCNDNHEVRERLQEWMSKDLQRSITFDCESSCFYAYAREESTLRELERVIADHA